MVYRGKKKIGEPKNQLKKGERLERVQNKETLESLKALFSRYEKLVKGRKTRR